MNSGDLTITNASDIASITEKCMAPAPIVVNGGSYAGCMLPKGHDGGHQVKITWSTPGTT